MTSNYDHRWMYGSIEKITDKRWTTRALFDFYFIFNRRFCLFSIVEMVNCARFCFVLHHPSFIHFLPARNIRYFFFFWGINTYVWFLCWFFPSFVRLHDYIFIFRLELCMIFVTQNLFHLIAHSIRLDWCCFNIEMNET